MAPPKPIVIFDIDDARAILKYALQYHQHEVFLALPTNSGGYLGGHYIKMMSDILAAEYPKLKCHLIADCADYAGHVIENIRVGVKYIIFNGDDNHFARLAELAAAYDAVVMKENWPCLKPQNHHTLENELKAWWNIKI